jgi:hypothetical protein
MWPYWIMFLIPAGAAAVAPAHGAPSAGPRAPTPLTLSWVAVILAMTCVIGFRYQVGADWFSYLEHYNDVSGADLTQILQSKGPAYAGLNWLSARLGLGVVGVNFVGGALFAAGLSALCRTQPRPWLALAVAVPYLLIVVAMGYSRQAIALALAMLGIVALRRREVLRFVAFVVLGALFHRSAVLLLPIAALSATRNRLVTTLWVGVIAAAAYWLLLEESVDSLYVHYVEREYQSQGALIRLLMNAFPAVILLAWEHRFRLAPSEARLWRWFAILSIVLLAVLAATPATTAVDRIALYALPLQVVVFGAFPDAFASRAGRGALVLAVLAYYGAALFVWLNYASHAYAWLPYRMLVPGL